MRGRAIQRIDGSSPRARGTHGTIPGVDKPSRLIPARAGNTDRQGPTLGASAAHPRARGEHKRPSSTTRPSNGSSPRARGTRVPTPRRTRSCRLIPARAGNTAARARSPIPPAAHPRARGEHGFPRAASALIDGSSPRARGTRPRHDQRDGRRRLIPARAGNTRPAVLPITLTTAHPRARGEHQGIVEMVGGEVGSSPRARGTLTPRATAPPGKRLIPARAGNTYV